ncbi:MAG: L,D-transpeptidase [Pseudomonadota bacterium]
MFIILFWFTQAACAGEAPWIRVDPAGNTLQVIQNDKPVLSFDNISIGRNGYARNRVQGDGKTPLGVFRVAWKNPNSRFHLFFGLDYPSQDHAEQAFRDKRIDFDTYYEIRRALYFGEVPPQTTALGGYIGIHGVGAGNPRVHEAANWTEGCVALTDDQIDQLARWVDIGTLVVIADDATIPALAYVPQQAPKTVAR